ncbi:MAG: hypothetical protein KGJ86_09850 [Chloroflexota bacterium]|nr:hypothetical protein [Chloroflexota bacterium]
MVLHQTPATAELIARLRCLLEEDPATDFALLVPATPAGGWATWDEAETQEMAWQRSRECRDVLNGAGIMLSSVRVGEWTLMDAISAELSRAGNYDGVVLSGVASSVPRLLRLDAPSRLRRQFPGLRVLEVSVPASASRRWGRRLSDSFP